MAPGGRSCLSLSLSISALLAAATWAQDKPVPKADLLIRNGNVYTLAWDDPGPEGEAAKNAPHDATGWRADAGAVAVRGGRIVFVGSNAEAARLQGEKTRVIDARGATVVPGLIDSHVHIAELGAALERVDLVGVKTEAEAVDRVAARAATVPRGEWIVGWGWDEGAWANRYPDLKLLSERVPDHPVYLKGLHSFAAWGNRLAFQKAGITAATETPAGGEIRRDAEGRPTGILTNRATSLLERAIPPPTPEQLKARIVAGLAAMAAAGYVAVHEAGADAAEMNALQGLEAEGRLALRVYAMLAARDAALLRTWRAKGPDADPERMLVTRSVKVFADGALGSRGARLLADYSDRPGHRGVNEPDRSFDKDLLAGMMKAGFQVAIHAIGDAGNREALDFFESVLAAEPAARALRHRIEHAQVLHPDDIPRFRRLGLIASMEPPHAVEDKAWAEERLGPERVKYAYAWRSLRRAGAALVFNSDLPGSGYDIFYGLHSAITRRGKDQQPAAGWHPEQRVTPEEALRGYTTWGAYAAFVENRTGVLAPGRWADITIMDLDPLAIGEADPGRLLQGKINATIVAGKVVYERK